MRFIDLHNSGGPLRPDGQPDTSWLTAADALLQQLVNAPDKPARDAIIDANEALWGQLREWLLKLSHDKCWYSEARDVFSVLEVEHYRPKKQCKRVLRGAVSDGYWWQAFDWKNYRLCGKLGNAKKLNFFPLADGSPIATYGGISILNEIPLLLDPASPGDPDHLSFNEDGSCGPHADADAFTELRVRTTTVRLNLNHGRVKRARQRIWDRCWQLIQECRELARQMSHVPAPAEKEQLNQKKNELIRMVQPDAEFSAVAKTCLLKSNISWAMRLACL